MAWERAENAGQTLALDGGEELVMPAVVWAEALAGVSLADSAARAARRMARLEALRRVMGIEPFTAETAEPHADIFASCPKTTSPWPPPRVVWDAESWSARGMKSTSAGLRDSKSGF